MFCVYGLFTPSLALELGIDKLKEYGFGGERLAVVVLEPQLPEGQTLLDSIYRNDSASLVDGITILSSIGMLMGVIYGSIVPAGPIALGLAGAVAGGGTGYLLDRAVQKKRQAGKNPAAGEVIVAVRCHDEEDVVQVEKIMKEYRALATGRGPVL
ncbi:MAG: hypothetical protein ACOY40_12350 [Bacillota bacterium]